MVSVSVADGKTDCAASEDRVRPGTAGRADANRHGPTTTNGPVRVTGEKTTTDREKPTDVVETHWEDLSGRELRYHDHTWSLTGDVRESGDLLAVEASRVDAVRHETATL